MYYMISSETLEEFGIPKSRLEKLFHYITNEGVRDKLYERGYPVTSDRKLQQLSHFIMLKFEDDFIDRMISYLNYRGQI